MVAKQVRIELITKKEFKKYKKEADRAAKRLGELSKDIYDMRGVKKVIQYHEDLAKMRFADDIAETLLDMWWEE